MVNEEQEELIKEWNDICACTNKENHLCFLQDNKGLWYLIPVSLRNTFDNDLCEITHYYEDKEIYEKKSNEFLEKYMEYRSLYPSNYVITERTIYKESNYV